MIYPFVIGFVAGAGALAGALIAAIYWRERREWRRLRAALVLAHKAGLIKPEHAKALGLEGTP